MPSPDIIDYINKDISNVKTELAILTKIVRDGNGQPALITQVGLLSNRLANVETALKNDIAGLKQSLDGFQQTSLERNKASWSFKAAVAVALITSFTSIVVNWQTRVTEDVNHKNNEVLMQKIDTLLQKK